MPEPWQFYEVSVAGLPPEIFEGPSRDKVRWRAYAMFAEHYDMPFARWLRVTVMQRIPAPPDDGYSYIREHYGLSPQIGGRMVLVDEGPNSGREVIVNWPGPQSRTSMIHAHYPGEMRSMVVHPLNVREAAHG